MTTLYSFLRGPVALATLTLVVPACAWSSHHALVRTAPGEEMGFDRMPTSIERPVSIAMPASAPCRLAGHGPDIVCALVAMDGTYYAAMRSRGEPGTQVAQDTAVETHEAASQQMATDD